MNMKKQDLFVLELVDGLKSRIGDQDVIYKTLRMRETNVADELQAVELAERVVNVRSKPTLLVSDELYRLAMNMRHIEAFTCAGLQDIGTDLIDLKMMGRLSSHDMRLIEERCMLISLAAGVRYGTMSQIEFDQAMSGAGNNAEQSPQPTGQPAGMDAHDPESQSGPQMLADRSPANA